LTGSSKKRGFRAQTNRRQRIELVAK